MQVRKTEPLQQKVVLVANTSWYLYNFRRPLARALRDRGLRPLLMAPRDEYSDRLLAEGFEWRELDVPRNRLNPARELGALIGFVRAYRREKPVAAHHFTIKCVIYGTVASIVAGVGCRINAVTGLGHVFLARGLKAALLRGPLTLAYRLLLSSPRSRVIFQNPDDREFFVGRGLVRPSNTRLIRGSGVDLSTFRVGPPSSGASASASASPASASPASASASPASASASPASASASPASASASPASASTSAHPITASHGESAAEPRARKLHIVFASRLLREKGILELIEAIRLLRTREDLGTGLELTIAGDTAAGNPSSVTQEEIQAWTREGLARFAGHVYPVLPLLASADIVVLPSYREGTPRILLEACALEKPVVTTDVPGCREVVEDGRNGLLVPARDSQALAGAIERLARDPALRERLGKEGRRKVEAEFSDVEVARQTVAVYEELGVLRG